MAIACSRYEKRVKGGGESLVIVGVTRLVQQLNLVCRKVAGLEVGGIHLERGEIVQQHSASRDTRDRKKHLRLLNWRCTVITTSSRVFPIGTTAIRSER